MAVTPDPPAGESETLPLGLLRRYLLATGWRRKEATGRSTVTIPSVGATIVREMLNGRTGGQRNFDQFILSEDGLEDIEIVLPLEKASLDYMRQIKGALRTLSDLEDREPALIIADIRLIGFDVVRSRIPDVMVYDDSIHLEIAANYIISARSLLASVATTEMQPDPYFLRVKPGATEFANHCRFGHTFKGSFGFTLESPVSPKQAGMFPEIEEPVPFERRVIQRLARGLRAACDAVERDDTGPLIDDVKRGFGANAYEDMADLVEKTSSGGLIMSFAFSSEWRPAADLEGKREFRLGPRHVEATRAAAKVLRTLSHPETILGRVTRLESEADPSDLLNPRGEREIVIQWSSEDVGNILVRVSLGPQEYLRAVEAHKSGRLVRVSGTLERKGRWVLSNPIDFHVL